MQLLLLFTWLVEMILRLSVIARGTFRSEVISNKNAFQYDAYRPNVDRILVETPPKNWRTPPKKLETPRKIGEPSPRKIGQPPQKIGDPLKNWRPPCGQNDTRL